MPDFSADTHDRLAFERAHFFDASGDLLCILGAEGSFRDVNPTWESVLSWTPGDLLGGQLSEFVHADDVLMVGREIRALAGTGDARFKARFRRADGEYIWLEWTLRGVGDDILGSARTVEPRRDDAAELPDDEGSYRRQFAENLLPMLLIDPMDGTILEANDAAVRFYGYERKQLIGMPISDINTLPLEEILPRLGSVASGNPEIFEFCHRLADGHIRSVEVSANGVRRGDRTVLHTIIRDVTERKAAEEELAVLAMELRRSNEELQQFAYVASHDLQEPLRMIASYTELLRRRYQGALDSDADDFIGFVVDGAKRMQRLLEDLLKYSRVGSHRGPMQEVDSGDVVRFALANLTVAVRETEAQVVLGALPVVRADESQLMQLFQNLIGNAIKFHRAGTAPCIHVGAVLTGGEWIFSVADEGIGVDQEYAESVFEVFRRLNPADAFPGTGIGLAVCKRIVERHGGRIWAEPNEPAGAIFRFTIPASEH